MKILILSLLASILLANSAISNHSIRASVDGTDAQYSIKQDLVLFSNSKIFVIFWEEYDFSQDTISNEKIEIRYYIRF